MNFVMPQRTSWSIVPWFIALIGAGSMAVPRSSAQESIVRCEGDRYQIEIYSQNDNTFLRVIDRQTSSIRRDQVPVEVTSLEGEMLYTNHLQGTDGVRLMVEPDGDCAALIGDRGEVGSITLGHPGGAPLPTSSDPAVLQAEAERKCVHVTKRFVRRRGYFIADQRSIRQHAEGYLVSLRAERAGRQIPVQCLYNSQTANIRVEGIINLPIAGD